MLEAKRNKLYDVMEEVSELGKVKDEVRDLGKSNAHITGNVENLSNKFERLEKTFFVFETAFNNNMKNLANHLKAHEYFEKRVDETEKRIESYVVQQLNNFKVLQAYIEKELLLFKIDTETCCAQTMALANAPWWKKLTKKKRNYIMLKAEAEIQDKYSKHLDELNDRLNKLTRESLEQEK